jgi:MraZ protein
VEEEGKSAANPPVEPPRGMYPARLDDKGRLKIPTAFQQFFNSIPERKLFVTSLDRRIAQIYPMAVWRENEKFFETYRANPGAAQNIAFNAADLGADAEMDGQGRITFNPELRRELDLEGHELHLFAFKGRVQVLTEAIYQERKRRASQAAAENLEVLEMEGLR